MAFQEQFGLRPLEGYGCTECSPAVTLNAPDFRSAGFHQVGGKRGKIGLPLPGTSVRILEPPQHGRLTIVNGQGFTSFARENQRYDCNLRKSDGTLVFYEPESGFAGEDSVTLDIIYPTGQSSRQRYAIDVR